MGLLGTSQTTRLSRLALDPTDYLLSLTSSQNSHPQVKLEASAYFSCNYRFIINTIRYTEHQFLLRVLR
ncbi:hypothetical protein EV702DRAFT_1117276 [Suillus placidus]|uniref:Uncharacterized protein n=1 Tax=Suillus placidus TaxID=48579 RepID=A0A9P7D1G1_9AGAM|nr:hypothetical protein EV702DRAFT_1117276 [Suillus placidus]